MKFLQLLMLFFGAAILHAQYSVSGTVHDFHNHIPLSGAAVTLGKRTAITDKQGSFKFENVASGTYMLSATHEDCIPVSQRILVNKNIRTEINLEHHTEEIETVVLRGKRTVPGIQIVKNVENLDRLSGENLGNVLANISGVSVLKTGNNIAKPIIHGLYGTRIAILNNGVKLEDQEWGAEHAPNVEIDNSQRIEVIKGASALRFRERKHGRRRGSRTHRTAEKGFFAGQCESDRLQQRAGHRGKIFSCQYL